MVSVGATYQSKWASVRFWLMQCLFGHNSFSFFPDVDRIKGRNPHLGCVVAVDDIKHAVFQCVTWFRRIWSGQRVSEEQSLKRTELKL